jgi:hypothetical protein
MNRSIACLLAFSCLTFQAAIADPAATRVVNHITKVQVLPNGDSISKWHGETKILDSAAVASYANPTVYSVDGLDIVQEIDGYTLKPDGRKLMIDPAKIEMSHCPANVKYCRPDAIRHVLHFPEVQVNDIVVVNVTRLQKTLLPGHYYDDQESFTSVDAGKHFEITVPKGVTLTVDAPGFEVRQEASAEGTVYILHHDSQGALPATGQYVALTDRSPRMFVSTFKSYDDVAKAYDALIAGKFTVTPEIKAKADEITAGVSDRREQARLIYEWMHDNVVYESNLYGEERLIPRGGATDTLRARKGECKDHTILYAALLRAKGIDAYATLLNGTDSYFLPKAPGTVPFNHMITWLPEFGFYADTTALGQPFGTVGFRLQGKPALRIGTAGPALDRLPSSDPTARSDSETIIVLDARGRVIARQTVTGSGSLAGSYRTLARLSKDPEQLMTWNLRESNMRNANGKFVFPVLTPASMQYSYTDEYQDRGHDEMLSGKGFVMPAPLIIARLDKGNVLGPIAENKYENADPVPCRSVHATDNYTLQFPAGKRVASLPPDMTVKTANLDYLAHWSSDGQSVSVKRELASHFDSALCTGAARTDVLAALARITQSYNTEIALVGVK